MPLSAAVGVKVYDMVVTRVVPPSDQVKVLAVGLPSVTEQSRVVDVPATGMAPPDTLVMILLGGTGKEKGVKFSSA